MVSGNPMLVAVIRILIPIHVVVSDHTKWKISTAVVVPVDQLIMAVNMVNITSIIKIKVVNLAKMEISKVLKIFKMEDSKIINSNNRTKINSKITISKIFKINKIIQFMNI